MGIWEINAWKLITAGGPIMVPILLCSFFALAIVIEKLIYFAAINTNVPRLRQRVFDSIKKSDFKTAIKICDESQSPVAKILKAGIVKFGSSREEIKESMEDSSLFEIPRLERRLSALATIAHISPLLGLLGTVTGLAGSFHTIQMQATSLNPTSPGDLAGSIWEALLTTVAGLIVAIPTFVAYNYLVSRVNTFVLETERSATELVNLLGHMQEAQSTKGSAEA